MQKKYNILLQHILSFYVQVDKMQICQRASTKQWQAFVSQ